RECRAPRNQGNKNGDAEYRSRDNTSRTIPLETSDALVVQYNALIVQDGLGYDWSYIAQDEPTGFAPMAYTSNSSGSDTELGLESVESQLIIHQKNEAVYEEKIAVLEFEVKDKGNAVTRLTNQLEQTFKEKEDLKTKLEQFETSSKNLNKLINNQLSTKDKTGLGYGDKLNENESEVINSVFDSRSSDGNDNQTNDRFKKGNEYHAVPPPLTENYIPLLADLSFVGLYDSVYRPTTNKTSASMSQVESVRPSRVIIEDWVSDDEEDIFQPNDVQTTVKPSFKKIEFTKARNELRMPKESVLGKGTGHREVRPIWNNTQRINHQNKFVPTAVLTRSERIPVSTAKQVSKEKVNIVRVNGINTAGQTTVSTVKRNGVTTVKASTGNKALLTDYHDIDGGFVAFGGSTRDGKITCISKTRTNKIDFEDVFFVKELNLIFSLSHKCVTRKNSVLFTETECLVLSPDFKLIDESQVLLRVPRQNNMYSFDLKNVVPSRDLTCLFAKATIDKSKLWHWRLGHVNFKTMNKLVKGNLVRGIPSKTFENDHTCVACQKGKQHKASCKTKHVSSISQPLQMLNMDLYGPTSIRSINHKTYCLVVTDDFSRFSWVFFLATKSETSEILKKFITEVENQLNHKVKVIRSDNGTKFKNIEMDAFCGQKGIKREYSVARAPQQNGVAERKNRTPIEAARTMLADSLLPIVFWAEAINTAYPLGKFDGKAEEGFLVGYSVNSKAFRVFNTETRKVEENLHVNFLENKPNVAGQGPNWLFDIDSLTNSMNYQPVTAGNQTNKNAGPQETNGNTGLKKNVDAGQTEEENVSTQQYIVFPLWSSISSNYKSSDDKAKDDTVDDDACKKTVQEPASKYDQALKNVLDKMMDQEKEATEQPYELTNAPFNLHLPLDLTIGILLEIQSTGIFGNAYDDHDLETLNTPYADQSVGAEADFNNMEPSTVVSPIPITRVHSIHPEAQIIRIKGQVEANQVIFGPLIIYEFSGYQMDVKSDFLYETIKEEVYVCHLQVFVDPDLPEKVYKVEKALYGLHQAPRACSTPMETHKDLTKDEDGEDVDVHLYRSMIGSLMYLTSSRLDIMFSVCVCSKFQVQPKFSHLNAVKRIFRYLKGQPKLGLWYPKDSPLILEAFSDSDYAGASLDRKSTTGGCQFLGSRLVGFLHTTHIKYALTENPTIYISLIHQFWETASATTNQNREMEITATIDGRLKTVTEASIRRHLKLEDSAGINSLPNAEIFEQLALMSSKKAAWEQFSSNIATAIICLATNRTFKEATPMPHESPLQSVHSLRRDEGSVSLDELTDLCTSLSKKVGALENEMQQTKKTYSTAITKLILRVKKLEQKVKTTKARRRARIILSEDVEGSSKQGRKISAIDKDPIISLVQPEQEMEHAFCIAKETTWFQEDVEIQEKNSADIEILLQEEEPTKLYCCWKFSLHQKECRKEKDKGKAIMKGDESVQKKTKKQLEQERLGHEEAIRLQEHIDEEERQRFARDAEIAKQLQEEINKATQEQDKQEVVTEADPTHVIDWSDPAMLRYHAQLNRPYSVAEVRKNMDHIQSFAHMDSKKEKGSEKKGSRNKSFAKKRAGEKQSDQSTKRKKMKDDAKKEDFKEYLNIVPEEGMNVEALRTKYPLIDWEIYTEDSRVYWKIIRVGDHTEIYQFFEDMLKNFDRDDLVKLWKLVKDRFSSTKPNDDKEKALWVELKSVET
ncbi:putative ribonuclease H-like domain-containing protein, partial [Tanacetum coccineum]